MYTEQFDNNLPRMTEAEYLVLADEQEFKYEYSRGHVYAMTESSVWHGVITANTSTHLNNQLLNQGVRGRGGGVAAYVPAIKNGNRLAPVPVASEREGKVVSFIRFPSLRLQPRSSTH